VADDRTGTDAVVAALDRGVLTLTLSRPDARNALSLEMLDGLARALDSAHDDEDVRVVVLTGAGGSFCAGGDVKSLARGDSIFGPAADPEGRAARHIAAQRGTSVRLWDFPKPTLALVNGPAVGAGLALALACDLRYAAASAVLRTGFVPAGLAGDFGCTWLLTALVGPARAKDLLYFSPTLTAARARDLGLVEEVFPDDSFAEEGLTRARRLAALPPMAVRAVASHVNRALQGDLAECSDAEVRWHVRLVDTPEHREAVAAVARRSGGPRPAGPDSGPRAGG
jgi:2-(1,2-epoxy-1,2-dihydrophenyl)acetyl-CoA isomerase